MRYRITFLALAAAVACLHLNAQDLTRPPAVADLNPSNNLPQQRVGREDLLALQVYDAPEFTRTVRISDEGTIRLPMLPSPMRVDGLMPSDIEKLIAEALQREKLLVDPYVTVNVVEYHSRPISVTGAVKSPIVFQAIGNVTLLEALARAGGIASDQAGPEIIVTRPNGNTDTQSIQRIPAKALISGSDPELNLKLTGGEEVRVPDVGKFIVGGNVNKPGLYPILDGAANNVTTAIAQAQGTSQYYAHTAYIYRPDDKGVPHEITVPLQDILKRKAPDMTLQARDVLYVPDSSGRRLSQTMATTMTGMGVSAAMSMIYLGIIH
ncbi:MAG TPA: polysaccharide biosynthesis/export family protein [Bryobacteraceae bacterium]